MGEPPAPRCPPGRRAVTPETASRRGSAPPPVVPVDSGPWALGSPRTGPSTLFAMPEKITMAADGTLNVPDEPIIPYIEGDGTGVDIWPASQVVFDAAAKKHGKSIVWKEVLA